MEMETKNSGARGGFFLFTGRNSILSDGNRAEAVGNRNPFLPRSRFTGLATGSPRPRPRAADADADAAELGLCAHSMGPSAPVVRSLARCRVPRRSLRAVSYSFSFGATDARTRTRKEGRGIAKLGSEIFG